DEPMEVPAFISKSAVEALDVGILHRSPLPPRFVPERRPTEADHSAGAPLGNSECSEKIAHSLAPSGGLYHFFRTTALSIWMSRAWSATSCLSRRFSSSSCFTLLASLTSMPPNFAFQR